MMTVLTTMRIALVVTCAVLGWAFVFRYARLRWDETAEGAHLMRFTIVVALILTLSAVFYVVEVDPLARAVITVLLFGWVAYELATRIRLLEQAQDEQDEHDRESASQ